MISGKVTAVTRARIEFLFGKNIFVDPGGLAPHEVAFARSVAELEGRNFMGPLAANQPGIDGMLFEMVSMIRFIQGGKQNLLWLPEQGTLSSITVFTGDGIVRSAGGAVRVLAGPAE